MICWLLLNSKIFKACLYCRKALQTKVFHEIQYVLVSHGYCKSCSLETKHFHNSWFASFLENSYFKKHTKQKRLYFVLFSFNNNGMVERYFRYFTSDSAHTHVEVMTSWQLYDTDDYLLCLGSVFEYVYVSV